LARALSLLARHSLALGADAQDHMGDIVDFCGHSLL
jgi:hypothetical protein